MSDVGFDPDLADGDVAPEDRVHHHAKQEQVKPGVIVTLCGLVLDGPRPGAAEMPCCPMCGAEMDAIGERCHR